MAKKKAAPKKGGGSKAGREVLVVASKVKAYMKSKNLNTSGDAIQAISDKVYGMLDDAASRTGNNGRKTLKPHDI